MADRHEPRGNEQFEFAVSGSDESRPIWDTTPSDKGSSDKGSYERDSDIDLSLVRADDVLLDSLAGYHVEDGRGDGTGDVADQELNALLLAWRRDVDSVPIGEVVDTETAMATVAAARASKPRRPKLLVPIAAAAAVLVIGFGGVAVVARDAQPGDALWGLTRVLYADHARSVEAAASVRTDLQYAEDALVDGRILDAKSALAEAGAALSSVASEDGQADLRLKHETLTARLDTGQDLPSRGADPTDGTGDPVPTSPVVTSSSVPSSETQPTNPSVPPSTSTAPLTSSTAPPTPSSITGDVPSGDTSPRGNSPGSQALTPGESPAN